MMMIIIIIGPSCRGRRDDGCGSGDGEGQRSRKKERPVDCQVRPEMAHCPEAKRSDAMRCDAMRCDAIVMVVMMATAMDKSQKSFSM